MNKIIFKLLFALGIIWPTGIFSQTVHKFHVYFESNTYTLSTEQQRKIDSVIKRLSNVPAAYKIDIAGHSDSTGTSALNYNISLKRANETKAYFANKGFVEQPIAASAIGEEEPVDNNATEDGRANNRRVLVKIWLNLPEITDIGGFTISGSSFRLPADSGGAFYDTSGSSVLIPPDAFVDENGKPVSGDIDFSYTEYRDPADFILSGLPMTFMSDKELYLFNSSGMFKLLAFKDGKPVYLKKPTSLLVNFAMDTTRVDLNLYRFDKKTGRWVGPPFHESDDDRWKNFRMSCGGSGGGGSDRNYCQMSSCDALFLLEKIGLRYAGTKRSIYEEFIVKDPLHALQTLDYMEDYQTEKYLLQRRIDSISRRIKQETHTYKIVVTRHVWHKVNFSITCYAKKNNEFDPLRSLSWKFSTKSNPGVFPKLTKNKWTYCKITPVENKFKIELSDSADHVELKNVGAITREHMRKKEKKIYLSSSYSAYETKRLFYQSGIEELEEMKNSLVTKLEDCKNKLDSIRRVYMSFQHIYEKLYSDSVYCFWIKSREYMPLHEKTIRFSKWLRYFDAHDAEMLRRYLSISTSNESLSCKQRKKIFKDEIVELPDKFIAPVKVETLGAYNLGKPIQINDTVEVFATYTDSEGKTVEPLIIYLTDTTFNGVIRYDGSSRYSPYRFRLSPTSVKSMVAFDRKGKAWLCTSNFETLPINGKQLKYTFVLKRIENIKSKKELMKQL